MAILRNGLRAFSLKRVPESAKAEREAEAIFRRFKKLGILIRPTRGGEREPAGWGLMRCSHGSSDVTAAFGCCEQRPLTS